MGRCRLIHITVVVSLFFVPTLGQGDIEAAISEAIAEVAQRRPWRTALGANLAAPDPISMHAMFSSSREAPGNVSAFGKAGDISNTATAIFASRNKGAMPESREFSRRISSYCPVRRVICNPGAPFRTADGTCNNLQNPLWGASITAQARFLTPTYGDGYNLGTTPRARSVTGWPLPNPRMISNAVHRGGTSPPRSNIYNIALTHFGQFIDHDIISTPILKDGNRPMRCCDAAGTPVSRPECFSFNTPPKEFRTTCMAFVRSEFGTEPGCPPGYRNQINQRTSFLDLSVTYGNTLEGQNKLRVPGTGRLMEGPGRILPNGPAGTECVGPSPCFKAGDSRAAEISMLTVIHSIFLREHNNIVEGLRQVNPTWSGESLYQVAKKILTGIYQHIVYTEFLPIILGQQGMSTYGLKSTQYGYSNSYNPSANPATRNAFGAAAFRFGHSLVGSFVAAYSPNFKPRGSALIENHFFRTEAIRNEASYGTDGIGRWMTSQFKGQADRFLTPSVRDKLFQTKQGNGFDLSALNIQRGRDHGIPSYNQWRKFCGLQPALHFGTGRLGLTDHDVAAATALRSVYRHPDDIDLFAGGLSEKLASGALVGPTFRCIIGLQFKMYKTGDRFFYENNFNPTGFTAAQLREIKSQTMAALYCRTINIASMPKNAFVSERSWYNRYYRTQRMSCQYFRKLDLRPWREYSYTYG